MLNFLKKRRLCGVCVCFSLSAALTYLLSYRLSPVFGLCAVIFFALTAAFLAISAAVKRKIRPPREALPRIACALFALLASALFFSSFGIRLPAAYSLCGDGEPVRARAVVTKVKYEAVYGAAYEAKLKSANGKEVDIGVELVTEYGAELEPGDLFEADAVISVPDAGSGSFDYRTYAMSRGILLTLTSEESSSLNYLGKAPAGVWRLFEKLSERLRSAIGRLFSDETEGVLSALVLGVRDDIPHEVKRTFERCGISHLLAVSGIHLTILLGAFDLAMTKFKTNGRMKLTLLILAALFYMCLTGLSASVVRASLMYIFFRFCSLSGRRGDPVTSLNFALAVILAFSPTSIADVSLLLSFSSTLGIVTLGMRLDSAVKKRVPVSGKGARLRLAGRCLRAVSSSTLITLSAVVCSLPVIWAYFGEVSLIFPITNLLLTFPVTLLIVLVPAALLLSGLHLTRLAALTAILSEGICRAVLYVAKAFSSMPRVMVSLRYPFAAVIGLLSVAVIGALVILRRDKIANIAAALAGACLLFTVCVGVYSYSTRGADGAIFTYSGSNDILTVYSNGKTLVCDISNGSVSTRYALMETLNRERYTSELDVYMITHYHARTVNQIAALLERETVWELLLPEPYGDDEAEYFSRINECAEKAGCGVSVYDHLEDSQISFGDITLEIAKLEYSSSTHPLSAINVVCRDSGLLYVGSSASFTDFVSERAAGSDHLIFGRHGPKTKLLGVFETSADITAPDAEPFASLAELYPKNRVKLLAGVEREKFVFEGRPPRYGRIKITPPTNHMSNPH